MFGIQDLDRLGGFAQSALVNIGRSNLSGDVPAIIIGVTENQGLRLLLRSAIEILGYNGAIAVLGDSVDRQLIERQAGR
jgi:hypothetical protein